LKIEFIRTANTSFVYIIYRHTYVYATCLCERARAYPLVYIRIILCISEKESLMSHITALRSHNIILLYTSYQKNMCMGNITKKKNAASHKRDYNRTSYIYICNDILSVLYAPCTKLSFIDIIYMYAHEVYACASAALQDPLTVSMRIKYIKSLIYRGNPVSIYCPDYMPRYSDIVFKTLLCAVRNGTF